MDLEKAKVYQLLANVAAKCFLALLVGVAFISVTFKLIFDPSWPLAAAELILTPTVAVVFKHYFPTKE